MTLSSPVASPSGIRTLEVILTAACNLRCAYCYQNDKQSRRMEWSTLRPALDLVLRSEAPALEVRFMGGEPLLELPLIRKAVEYVKRNVSHEKEVLYAISTNGLLLDDDAIELFAEHEFDTQLSFDGAPAAQDIRGHGTFAKLDALLDHLRDDFPGYFRRDLHVALTLHGGNLRYLADSVEYFLRKEIPRIRFGPLLTHDPSWTVARIDELDDQFHRIFDSSLEHFRLTGQVPVECFRKTTESDRHRPVGRAMCGVADGQGIAIDVDGEVTGCVTFAESYQELPPFLKERLDPMRMGKLRGIEFRRRLALYPAAARAAGIFHQKETKYSSYRRCGECEYVAECNICPTSIGHIPGNTDPNRVPDLPCAFNLVAFKYRDMFPEQPSDLDKLAGLAPLPALVEELRAAVTGQR